MHIRSKDWFVTTDLKDAYFHKSILSRHRKFLRFTFGGKSYQYQVVLFLVACFNFSQVFFSLFFQAVILVFISFSHIHTLFTLV